MIRFLLAALAWAMFAAPAQAEALAPAKGPVVLTVSGRITRHNATDAAEFDAAMLEALPLTRFSTTSPWHGTPVAYAGPSLAAVLKAAGARKGKSLRLIALDQYEVSVPFTDAAKFGPVLALSIDGKRLTVAELGPLLMIYPFDARPELKNETYYSRSIWQLQRIVVE